MIQYHKRLSLQKEKTRSKKKSLKKRKSSAGGKPLVKGSESKGLTL